AYGAVGAVHGLSFGVIAALLGTDGFALAFAGEAAALAFLVARFRIIRDVFLEQVPRGPLPLLVQVGALIAVAAIAFAVWRALRGADERRSPLTRPGIAAVVLALLAAAWAGGAQLAHAPAPAPSPPRAAAPAGAPNVVLIMVDTLPEVLGRAGYHTVGFADNANVSQAFNFQQGFDEYHYLAPDFFFAASEPAAQLALYSGLRLVRERFLAHYVDVHHYYQPAEVVTAEV